MIAIRKNREISKQYKIFSVIVAVAVFISTLTTKQHVIFDVIAGVFLAEGSYWFVQKSGFLKWYCRVLTGRKGENANG